MLKYKLNIKDRKNDVIEVKYESLFLSEDGSEITGVTEPSYGLTNIDTITVVSNESIVCSLTASDVMRCGYVIYNKKYIIQDFGETIGILYENGQYYCVDKHYYKKYQGQETSVLSEYNKVVINPYITIDNKEYQIGEFINEEDIEWFNEINIPTKYWVYDNKVTIDNVIYDVVIDTKTKMTNNEDYYPYIVLNNLSLDDRDRILYVIDWEYSKRKKVTLFKVFGINQKKLQINDISCVKQHEYFDMINEDGTIYRVYADMYEDKMDFFALMKEEGKQIKSEWKKVKKSNVIDLYVAENINDLASNVIVNIIPINTEEIAIQGEVINGTNNIVFTYYGKEYVSNINKKINFLQISGEEYEIYDFKINEYEDNILTTVNKPYIIFNNIPINIKYINENKVEFINRFDGISNIICDVISYNFVEINNKIYKIQKRGDKYFININEKEKFPLQIIEKIGSNVIRCLPMNDEDLSNLFASMYNSIDNYICEIKTPIFDIALVQPLSEDTKSYITSNILFFISHSSLLIPLTFKRDVAIDLHKDYITHNNFLAESDNLNRIVDMEKDIYYPAYAEEKNGDLIMTLCHQIQIDLHFRSRDLQTWVVNDENNVKEHTKYPTNWNIFDYYRYSNDEDKHKELYPILSLKDDNRFYLPSDLLYFLNFTNEDVFYQKQKIAKSFLRLSFYNSKDPQTQSLLYSTTIFMSETNLYQKYINADMIFSEYVTIKERGFNKEKLDENNNIETIYTVNNKNVVQHIGVDTEPCESNKKHTLTFNEDKRLSSSFIIKNRNEAIDSCEGFYLYLFKEYSNGLHENTIYMKVQFNHAGMGKTINFMQLFHQKDGKKSMLNWNSKYNFDKYKDGCPLNELYDHIYIEIKIKYDVKNKRFCYYLPQWMSEKNSDKHTMRLSLFEVKIKDESK